MERVEKKLLFNIQRRERRFYGYFKIELGYVVQSLLENIWNMSNCCEREVIIEKIWIQKLNSPVEIKHVFLLLLRTKYILLMRKLPISVDVSAQGKVCHVVYSCVFEESWQTRLRQSSIIYKTTLINDINFCCVNIMHAVDDYAGIVCCSTLIRWSVPMCDLGHLMLLRMTVRSW